MPIPEYTLAKTRDGWQAETEVILGPALDHWGKPGQRTLRISTHKSGPHVVTTANTQITSNDGTVSFSMAGGKTGDINKRIYSLRARATENGIRAAHQYAMRQLPELIAEAKAHYGITEEPAP
jgi:hypothetical protein